MRGGLFRRRQEGKSRSCPHAVTPPRGTIITTHELSFLRSTLTVAVLAVTGILAVGQTYVVLGMLEQIAADLHTTQTAAAATSSVFGVSYAAGFLASGPLAARFGARRVLLAGLSCASVAAVAVSFPTTLDSELVLRALQGLCTAVFAPCALVYVSQHFPLRLRTLATTALTTAFLASAVVMPLLAASAAAVLGWRGVFTACGALLLMCTICLWMLLQYQQVNPVPVGQALLGLPRVLRSGRLLALYVATAGVLAGYIAFFTALQLSSSTAVHNFPGGLQGLRLATLPALVAVTGAAGIMHRLSSWQRATGGFILAACGAAAVLGAGANAAVLGAGVLVFAGAIALTAPALVARIIEVAPPGETAGATAWYGTFMFLGGSIGPVMAASVRGAGLGNAVVLVILVAAAGSVLVVATRRDSQGATRRG